MTMSRWIFKGSVVSIYSVYATCTDRLGLVGNVNPLYLRTIMTEIRQCKSNVEPLYLRIIMTEIRQCKSNVEQKLAPTIADLKRKVVSAQKRRRWLAQLINSKRKITSINSKELQGAFASAKTELDLATPQY